MVAFPRPIFIDGKTMVGFAVLYPEASRRAVSRAATSLSLVFFRGAGE